MTSSKKGHISRGWQVGQVGPPQRFPWTPMDFLTFCCSRVQAERIGPRLFWPFLFGDHAILALFGSSVLGIGDFPFSAGMQQWDQHRNHSGDCYGDHDNDHDYDHDNDDDVHGDHCRPLSSNIDQQMGMPQLPLPKRGGFNSCKRGLKWKY